MKALVLGCLLLAFFGSVSLARAADIPVVVLITNDPTNVGDKAVDTYWVAWALNVNESNNFLDRNLLTVSPQSPSEQFTKAEFTIDAQEGDTFQVAVRGCNIMGECSGWTESPLIVIQAELLPGETPDNAPNRPGVYVMLHATVP